MVVEEDNPKEPSEVETKLEELTKEQMRKDDIGDLEEGTHVIILRPKKTENGVGKPMKVILERPSTRMAQHLKPLYINAHFDGLLIDRVLSMEAPQSM